MACPLPPDGTGGTGGGSGALSNPAVAQYEHIGCNDAPVRCLTPSEQSACNLTPGPNDPPCPFPLGPGGPAEQTACGSNTDPGTSMLDPTDSDGEINATTMVLAQCNLYQTGIPTDKPNRYCFASCIDETWTYASCQSIDNGGQCTDYCQPTGDSG